MSSYASACKSVPCVSDACVTCVGDRSWPVWVSNYVMSAKYEIVQEKVAVAGGGFMKAFRIAIVEMTCMGERRFDVAGYPYETSSEALADDWSVIGQDGQTAIRKIVADAERADGETQTSHDSK